MFYILLGMPHVHGVAWIEKSYLNKKKYLIPGTNDFSENAIELIDRLVTCKLPNNDTKLLDIVTSVQKHQHTKSCRKYNGNCRYSAPWLPSPVTIIAEPLPSALSDEDKAEKMSKARDILERARAVLEDPKIKEDMSFQQFLEAVDVTKEDYMAAISISNKGSVIVLKRAVSERFINGYNAEWLKAWNANMDFQFCLNPHAIITYITDYMGKTTFWQIISTALS